MTHVTLYAEVIDLNALFGGINNNAMASRNYTVNCLLVIHLSSCISDSHHDYIFLYYLSSLQMSPFSQCLINFPEGRVAKVNQRTVAVSPRVTKFAKESAGH